MAGDPEKTVVMGRVLASWGVQGWVKIEPFSAERDTLCRFSSWLLQTREGERRVAVAECKVHGAYVVARFEDCRDRDRAETYRGSKVALKRGELPPAGPNEVYQSDLVGLEVVNLQGERLGRVEEIVEGQAHPIVRVAGEGKERLLPLVPAVIHSVDLQAGVVQADWGADW